MIGQLWVFFIRCVSLASTENSREVPWRSKGNKSQEPPTGWVFKKPALGGWGLRSRKFRLASSPFLQTLFLKKEVCLTLNYKNLQLEL